MIVFHAPRLEELWFREALIGDGETMAYNRAWGGAIAFPREEWAPWYAHWLSAPGDERFYRYLKDTESGRFVGEAAYHLDRDSGRYLADVIVHAACRRRGCGAQGLRLLCESAKERGVRVLYDNLAIDNPALSLFLREGFIEESRTEDIIWLKKALTD